MASYAAEMPFSRRACSRFVWVSLVSRLYLQLQGTPDSSLLSRKSRNNFIFCDRSSSDNLTMLRFIMARLERDRPSIRPSDKFSGREVLRTIRSPHVIIVFILFFLAGAGAYGLALFIPSIVSELGFSQTKTQLLSVGPFAAGFIGACFRRARPIHGPSFDSSS